MCTQTVHVYLHSNWSTILFRLLLKVTSVCDRVQSFSGVALRLLPSRSSRSSLYSLRPPDLDLDLLYDRDLKKRLSLVFWFSIPYKSIYPIISENKNAKCVWQVSLVVFFLYHDSTIQSIYIYEFRADTAAIPLDLDFPFSVPGNLSFFFFNVAINDNCTTQIYKYFFYKNTHYKETASNMQHSTVYQLADQ